MKKKINVLVCRSGGRTSERMYKFMLAKFSSIFNIIGIFANTGWEHPLTLEFVHKNDIENERLYGVKPIWLEAVVHDSRKACTHKVVTYETASRRQEPFEAVCSKYGVPNKSYMHCTRELKENPIKSYCKNVLGWDNRNHKKQCYYTAIGIRGDENQRMFSQKSITQLKRMEILPEDYNDMYAMAMNFYFSGDTEHNEFDLRKLNMYNGLVGELSHAHSLESIQALVDVFAPHNLEQSKIYPLVAFHPDMPDKLDMLDWWEDRDFDLGLPEYLGNCVGCFKKSYKKCLRAAKTEPLLFKSDVEVKYGYVGSNKIDGEISDTPRTMYRDYRTSSDIIALAELADSTYLNLPEPEHLDEGCASSCNPFGNPDED